LTAFQRFVAMSRLDTDADRTLIKAHAFCNPEGASVVTAVLANPGTDELDVGENRVVRASQWTIASPDGLTGERATIEGESVDEAGRVPAPEGTPVHVEDGTAFAAVEPESLVFVSLELAGAAGACAN
jgi:hypothetical protein